MSFLDCNGVLIPASSEAWKEGRDNKEANEKPPKLKGDLMFLSFILGCFRSSS